MAKIKYKTVQKNKRLNEYGDERRPISRTEIMENKSDTDAPEDRGTGSESKCSNCGEVNIYLPNEYISREQTLCKKCKHTLTVCRGFV